MEIHESKSSGRRLLKRKPLADLTNSVSIPSSSSTTFLKPKPKSKPATKPKPSLPSISDDFSLRYDTGRIGSCNSENPVDRRSIPSSTPRAKENSVNKDVVDEEKSEHSIVYTRRTAKGMKDKGKSVADVVQSSCPPMKRIKSFGDKREMEHKDVGQHETCSVPYTKPNKKWHYAMSEHVDKCPLPLLPPQEFIEKQKAYFAEIDAFQLPEEVVSDSELE